MLVVFKKKTKKISKKIFEEKNELVFIAAQKMITIGILCVVLAYSIIIYDTSNNNNNIYIYVTFINTSLLVILIVDNDIETVIFFFTTAVRTYCSIKGTIEEAYNSYSTSLMRSFPFKRDCA